ncbi:MAG TPA: lactate utilization protein [Acidimicrobiales bacterium]|nr:lactate utilization protein [Acidimicrobiales bacterium]
MSDVSTAVRTWRVSACSPYPADRYLRRHAIETTATEEPRTWSVPATCRVDGWRAQTPVARRILPRPVVPPPWADEPDDTVETEVVETDDDVDYYEPPAPPAGPPENEHGDRTRFLTLARQGLAGGIPVNLVHPPPRRDPSSDRPPAPEPTYANVDPDDLLATFTRSVEEAGGVCHHVVGQVPDILLDQLVTELDAWDVVVSQDPEAIALGERLADRGVEVSPAGRAAATEAALGVTSAVAGIAATGSVVIDSTRAGGRLSSVLPPAHVCVLPVERLVATPAEVLRPLGDDPAALPSSLVLVTGPSRTGDIEQLLTIGAHGPTALHVIVVSPPPGVGAGVAPSS